MSILVTLQWNDWRLIYGKFLQEKLPVTDYPLEKRTGGRLKKRRWRTCWPCVTHRMRPHPRRSRQQDHPPFSNLSLSLSLFLSRQQRPFSSLHPREYWIPILRCPLRQRTLAVWTFIREFGRNQSEGEVKGRGLPSLERERERRKRAWQVM